MRNPLRIALQSGHLLASMAQGLAADVIYVLKAGRASSLGLTRPHWRQDGERAKARRLRNLTTMLLR